MGPYLSAIVSVRTLLGATVQQHTMLQKIILISPGDNQPNMDTVLNSEYAQRKQLWRIFPFANHAK